MVVLPLEGAIVSGAVFVIESGSNGWAETPLEPTQNDKRSTICVNKQLIGTHGLVIERAFLCPHVSPNPQTGGGGRGAKNSPFKLQPNGWKLTEMSIEHI